MLDSGATMVLGTQEDVRSFAVHAATLWEKGESILLSGTLGVGKTTFARYLIHALIGEGYDVTSPSFSLIHCYPFLDEGEIWHVDLYRIEDVSELRELGLEEALREHRTVIEWPEKLDFLFPENYLRLMFEIGTSEQRVVSLRAGGTWEKKLIKLLPRS